LASGIERDPMPDLKIAAMAWYEQLGGFVGNFFSRAGRSDVGANSAVPFAVITGKNSQDQRRVLLLSRGWGGQKARFPLGRRGWWLFFRCINSDISDGGSLLHTSGKGEAGGLRV
jgi:hypothetical protein